MTSFLDYSFAHWFCMLCFMFKFKFDSLCGFLKEVIFDGIALSLLIEIKETNALCVISFSRSLSKNLATENEFQLYVDLIRISNILTYCYWCVFVDVQLVTAILDSTSST